MPILNYTTGIDADRTIAEIQKMLAMHGAQAILAEYDDQGRIDALSFRIDIDGQVISFRLPTDWRPVLKVLEIQKQKLRDAGKRSDKIKADEDQARRVAWRIVKDWVEAQMAIVEMQMVKMDQVFLPYAVAHDGRTFYEIAKSSNLLSAPQS